MESSRERTDGLGFSGAVSLGREGRVFDDGLLANHPAKVGERINLQGNGAVQEIWEIEVGCVVASNDIRIRLKFRKQTNKKQSKFQSEKKSSLWIEESRGCYLHNELPPGSEHIPLVAER